MHPRRKRKECGVEPTLPHIRACCCSSRAHIHPAACSNVARSRTVPTVHSGGRCEHGMRRVSHVRGREGRVRRFVRRGLGYSRGGAPGHGQVAILHKVGIVMGIRSQHAAGGVPTAGGSGLRGRCRTASKRGFVPKRFLGPPGRGRCGHPGGQTGYRGRDVPRYRAEAARRGTSRGASPRVLPHAPSKRG